MSGTPTADSSVTNQSLWLTIPFSTAPGRDAGRPAHHRRDAVGALPVRVLLVAVRGHPGVGPGVHVRTVVGGVHDDRVLGDAELVEQIEQITDQVVVVEHRVVVLRLPAPGAANALGFGWVRKCMWVVLNQTKNGVCASCWRRMKSHRGVAELSRRRSPSASWSAARCPRCAGCRRGWPRCATPRAARTSPERPGLFG